MTIIFGPETFELDNFPQYEDIRHTKNQKCECEYSSIIDSRYQVVGYCETRYGYMIVCECPKCFEKFRCHINSTGRYNLEEFKHDAALMIYLQKNR